MEPSLELPVLILDVFGLELLVSLLLLRGNHGCPLRFLMTKVVNLLLLCLPCIELVLEEVNALLCLEVLFEKVVNVVF